MKVSYDDGVTDSHDDEYVDPENFDKIQCHDENSRRVGLHEPHLLNLSTFNKKIIESFLNLVSNSKGELKAKLVSSKELTIEEQKKIQDDFSKDFKSPINIDYKYDPSLIGGLVIQVGSIMVDASIKKK